MCPSHTNDSEVCGKLFWVVTYFIAIFFGFVILSGEGWGGDNPQPHILPHDRLTYCPMFIGVFAYGDMVMALFCPW